MSKCVVHMMKMKSGAIGGIQSHNQREHESKKNHEIDYDKSVLNYDLINADNINYQRAIKDRIEDLDLKKGVRKDAVLYCSFIVSSDKVFFEKLAQAEHESRESGSLDEPTPFEYMNDEYRADCMKVATRGYFSMATTFFANRYGLENVINATVHLDESTPHLHLGIVPVTKDGKLSAKQLFTPLELKQLQTDFAEKVGSVFGLERGKEGSDVAHLDEVTFKIKKREEEAERLNKELAETRRERSDLVIGISNLNMELDTLDDVKTKYEAFNKRLEATIQEKREELSVLEKAIKEKREEGDAMFSVSGMAERINRARQEAENERRIKLVERFLELPQIKPMWEKFRAIEEHRKSRKNRDEHER